MANRLFRSEFLRSFQKDLVFIEGRATIGASGAVSLVQGTGVASVTKLGGTGTYLIKLEDGYDRLLDLNVMFRAGVTGSAVTAGSFAVGTPYQITTLGTTDYTLIGARSNAVGVVFVATAVGTGTGTATAIGNSAIVSVEVVDQSVDGASTSALASAAGIIVQCKSATATLANPTSGTVMQFSMMLRNSNLKGKGEV